MPDVEMTSGPAAQIGFRNQLRARWRALPEHERWIIAFGLQGLLALLLWNPVWKIDGALAIGELILFRVLWLRRLSPIWRLAGQVGIVAVLAAFAASYQVRWSAPIAFVIGFALTWVPQRHRRWLPAAGLALAVAYPFVANYMFTMPVFGVFPDVGTGVYMIVFVMMAVGLNIVVGYAGLLDLGYVAFYAIGAYVAAWFASVQFSGQSIRFGAVGLVTHLPNGRPAHVSGIHISIWLLIPLAGIVTALFGVIIGLPTLRLRGDYLAIVTLGFGEILPQVALNGNNLGGFNLTNGPNGITPVDPPGWGHALASLTHGLLPANYSGNFHATFLFHHFGSADPFFWTALVLLVFTVFVSIRLRDSRLGRAWVAIREDETAAAAMGIPLMRTKTWAYASGAFFGGIAGAYYASFKGDTFPGDFYFNISVFILCMVILGGMGNIWGVILGAAFLAYLNEEGLANTGAWINTNIHIGSHHPNLDIPLYASGIYGVIIVAVMLLRPEGLLPSKQRAAELHSDEPESAYDEAKGIGVP